jgi:pimeloyl-ACP methyl ester carboxylesterase
MPVLLLCSFIGLLHAGESKAIGVVQVETRANVRVPLFEVWNPGAVATLVLFSGGGGGYGKIGDDGWPASRNFLIRTGKYWAAHPFNIVMVGRPSDGIDLQNGAMRIGEEHAADNVAIFKAVKSKSALPIWLVGTSMGTISAAAAAIGDTDRLVAGVVLTSSVTGYRIRGAVPGQDLAKIRVPVLVVHHARDACKVCTPYEARNIVDALSNAPVKEMVLVEAGSGATGDACEALHYHGYIGAEKEVVDLIANWIEKTNRQMHTEGNQR